jgi:hypothetical protein
VPIALDVIDRRHLSTSQNNALTATQIKGTSAAQIVAVAGSPRIVRLRSVCSRDVWRVERRLS